MTFIYSSEGKGQGQGCENTWVAFYFLLQTNKWKPVCNSLDSNLSPKAYLAMRNNISVTLVYTLNFKVVLFGRQFLQFILNECNVKQLYCLFGVFLEVRKLFRFYRIIFYNASVSGIWLVLRTNQKGARSCFRTDSEEVY